MNAQRYTLLQAGETMVGGLMAIPEEAAKMGVRPAWMGYIAVDDVKAYADKVKAAGGAIHRPPTDIPNVGTFAIAGDPSGAGFLLFKGNSDQAPVQDPAKPGHIGWHELHGGDPESSFAFYSGLFGWTKGEAMDMGADGDIPDLHHQGPAERRHDEEDGARSPPRTGSITSPSTRSTQPQSGSSPPEARSSTGRCRFPAGAGSSMASIRKGRCSRSLRRRNDTRAGRVERCAPVRRPSIDRQRETDLMNANAQS